MPDSQEKSARLVTPILTEGVVKCNCPQRDPAGESGLVPRRPSDRIRWVDDPDLARIEPLR